MPRTKDLTGQHFGQLTVIGKTEKKQNGYMVWKCRCDCGNEVEINTKQLTRGSATNCGCTRKSTAKNGPIAEDLTGQVFGKLTVLSKAENVNGRTSWNCQCSCGKKKIVSSRNLKSGKTRSCGCLKHTHKSKYGDLIGQQFGRLTVLYPSETNSPKTPFAWHCRCECGKEMDAPEEGLIYGHYKSCGCLKEEIQKNVPNQLHRIDGTCLEWLEKRKHRCDNTSGFRGVYLKKNGRYYVSIGFKGKRFNLGTYKTYEEAVSARLEAEEQIHDRFVRAYYIWKEENQGKGMSEEEIPLIFEVEKVNGGFEVVTNIKVE